MGFSAANRRLKITSGLRAGILSAVRATLVHCRSPANSQLAATVIRCAVAADPAIESTNFWPVESPGEAAGLFSLKVSDEML